MNINKILAVFKFGNTYLLIDKSDLGNPNANTVKVNTEFKDIYEPIIITHQLVNGDWEEIAPDEKEAETESILLNFSQEEINQIINYL
jgi:hypothetical protein